MWKYIVFKHILVLFCIVFCFRSYAQDSLSNVVRVNLVSATFGQFSGEYERILTPKFSINGTVAFMPMRALPFKSAISKSLGKSSIVNAARLGIFALAVEGRYYLSKNSRPTTGFYLAPFLKYTYYDINTAVSYSVKSYGKASIPITGGFNTFTTGLAVGTQWKINERFLLDWRIVGVSYGISNGSMVGRKVIAESEQKEILDKLNDLADKLPVTNLVTKVTAHGVKSKIDGSWLGLRTGLSIGYRF